MTKPLLLVLSLCGAAPLFSAPEDWHSYDADALPTDSKPAWKLYIDHNRSLRRLAGVSDGLLHVVTRQPHDNICWSVGSTDSAKGDEFWKLDQKVGATVEWRIRVLTSEPSGTFQMQIADGRNYWSFFLSDRSVVWLVTKGKATHKAVPLTSFQTFRASVTGGRLTLYLGGRDEPLFGNIPASGQFAAGQERNALFVGDFSGGAAGRFDLDFIRWTDKQAVFKPVALVESDEKEIPSTESLEKKFAKISGGPSILLLGHRHHAFSGDATQRAFLRLLAEKHGFRVAFREQEFRYSNIPGKVDPAEFKKYEAVVYLNPVWPQADEDRLTETFAAQWDAALQYVRDGGGLLFMPWVSDLYLRSVQKCFEPIGLQPLKAIPVDTDAERATVMQIAFSYTDEIDQKHPAVRGVKGLWVPVHGSAESGVWNANSVPFRVNDEWTVLARYSRGVKISPYNFEGLGKNFPEPVQRDQEESPLLAVRKLGKGRIAFLGVHSAYHIVGGMAPGYEGIFLEKGLRAQPSDGERLLSNLLNWLAEPARASSEFGGGLTELEAIEKTEFKPAASFKEPTGFSNQRRGYKGIIGALSPRSGGKSSVDEMATAAQAKGFDFLVVLDDVNSVGPAEFELLNRQAKAASTETFKCIPGLRFRDEVGNRFVAFRQGLSYPTEIMFAKDRSRGKRFHTVIRKGDRSSGTSGLGLAKWVQANGHRMAVAHYRDQKDLESDDPYEYGTPPWDIRPYREFHSVITYDESGTKIDEMIDAHKVVVDDGQHPHPVALTFLTSADDIAKVASGKLPHTVRWTKDFVGFPANTAEAPAYLPTSYATEGPMITRWQWDSRDLESRGNYWDWTYYYHRWAVGVESEVGLSAVEIWDGKDLVRRWSLDGAKAFSKVVTVNKHQLTMPLVIAIDVNGKRAITDGFQWRSHNFYVSWCSDRVNTLSYSGLPSPKSPWGSSAGNWPITTQPKGPMWDNLRIDLNLDILRFPGFDGQANGGSNISPAFYFHPAEGQPRDGRLYRHITWPMGSHEAVVQEAVYEHQLLPEQSGPHGWSTLGPLEPTEVIDAKLRYTTFVHYGHTPAPVLVEGEATFKQDVESDPKRSPFSIAMVSASRREGGYRVVSVQNSNGNDCVYPIFYDHRDVQHKSGNFPSGAFAWFFPSTFGPMGAVSLSDEMDFVLWNRPTHHGVQLRVGKAGQRFKKGDKVRWKYLAVTSGFDDFTGIDTPSRIVGQMGIDGSPHYTVEAVSGKVTDSRYVLTLTAGADGAGFRGTIRPTEDVRKNGLPVALPLIVEGLNDRWSAFLWDVEKRKMRPLPVAEGKAYAHYKELREDTSIYMGHPFVCDDPGVFLTAVQTGDTSMVLNIHNPTEKARTLSVQRAKFFEAVPAIAADWNWTGELKPGDEKTFQFGPRSTWMLEQTPE